MNQNIRRFGNSNVDYIQQNVLRRSQNNNRYFPYPNQPSYPYSYLPSQMNPSHNYNQYPTYNNQYCYPQATAAAQYGNAPPRQYNNNPNRYFNYQQQTELAAYGQKFNPRYHNRSHGPNFQPRHNHKPNKPKINKRDLPENNKYFCEVCDRGFKTEEKYEEHCQTHRTCGVNGCKFTAAEKLVEIHFLNFHASGVDRKVSNLESPEDIQKYINERKKNFPTRENVVVKSKNQSEKFKRGAPLRTKQYGRLNKNKWSQRNEACEENEEARQSCACVENEPGEQSDNDAKQQTKHGLTKIRKRVHLKRKNKHLNPRLYSQKAQAVKNRYKVPTLLQKLLADEIRHERNIILQCVRYVVQNNFFDAKSMPKVE